MKRWRSACIPYIFLAFVLILLLGGTPSGECRALCRRFIRAHRPDTSVFGISTILCPAIVLPLNGGHPWRNHYLTDLHITSCYQSVCIIGSVTHLVANHDHHCLIEFDRLLMTTLRTNTHGFLL